MLKNIFNIKSNIIKSCKNKINRNFFIGNNYKNNSLDILKKTIFIILVFIFLFNILPIFLGAKVNNSNNKNQTTNLNKLQDNTDLGFYKLIKNLYENTGFYYFIYGKKHQSKSNKTVYGWENFLMIIISCILLYLGIVKGFEPLLLIPIGFGGILTNIPFANIGGSTGYLGIIFDAGIKTGLFPILIFMGIGSMTDFGPLIANPITALLGAAAQLGIFATLIGASLLNVFPNISFTFKQACAISIIGGADGPTSIYVASKLSTDLLGAIAVAAYSYMALVPLIQPPIMKLLTTKKERIIKMEQLRKVSKTEKIFFPLIVLFITIIFLPSASPLIGALTFGNLVKECGVVERISKTLQNELTNIVTILLGLGVGTKLEATKFLNLNTIGILILGLFAFSFGTAGGILFGKLLSKLSKKPINPLIGAAGVSAVPMAARVVNKEGLKANPQNFLLMHAMGPNVAGVIGSAVAAGIILALFL